MPLFAAQVKALVVKDLKIARNNKKGTAMEVAFPLLMGVMTGLFILLFNYIQSGGNEYANNEPIHNLNNSIGVPQWLGYYTNGTNGAASELLDYLRSCTNNNELNLTRVSSPIEMQAAFENAFEAYNETSAAVYGGFTSTNQGVDVFGAPFGDSKAAIRTYLNLGLLISQLHYASFLPQLAPTVQWMDITINLRAIFSSTGAVLLIYAFIPALTITAGRLVEDKRVKARETLKVMGCSDAAYLIASAIAATLRMSVGVSLISLVLAAFGAIPGSDIPQVFGIALLFACSLIAFAQITPSVTITPTWANVLCIVLLAGGAVVSGISTGWTKPIQLLMCLVSPVAFYYGIMPSLSEGSVHLLVSPADAAVMLFVDTLLYIIIGNYIYAINPGEFGVPKHPLFFIRWIWTRKSSGPGQERLLQGDEVDSTMYRVVLQNLTKFYGSSTTPSVDHLSISIKVGEIYALLGHNGAGKTTTMSILTGMITPSSYDIARIGDYDISQDMDRIRESVGLCPQFDVLFGDLSARDHLLLFASIKGVPNPEEAAQNLLDDLELPTDNQRTDTFSGGMKRRLSVGNAIVGGATLLFLDEPSSGMDPLSRRQMWDLLKRLRDAGKTIVLTTHFMEEADYLGDRIAIMTRGRLFCCATSSELKHRYGVGFTVTAAKGPNCDVDGIRNVLSRHVSEVKVVSDGVGDVSFELPTNQLPKFAEMLTDLEAQLQRLGVASYGVTMSSLEDVFVAISTAEEKKIAAEKDHTALEVAPQLNDGALEMIGDEHMDDIIERALRVPYASRVLYQTKVVFHRKLLLLVRSRRMQLMVLLFPLFFLFLAFLSIQPQTSGSAASFVKTKSVDVTDFNYVVVSLRDQSMNDALIANIESTFQRTYGVPIKQVFKVLDYGDFASGLYLPVKSTSFVNGFNSPDVATGVIVHQNGLDKIPAYLNATVLYNRQFDASFAATAANLLATAAQNTAADGNATLIVSSQSFAEPAQGGSSKLFDFTKLYNVMQLGIYMVLSIGQIVASCAVPMADEVTRHIYQTNMALGMAPVAYFLGNFCFDLLVCVYPFLLFTIGVYWQNIESYHSSALIMCIIAGLLYCSHAILQAYIFVTYLQGMKPYVYTVMIHGVNLATLGAPYLIGVILQAAKVSFQDEIYPYLVSIFPASSWYHIIDNVSDFQKADSSASAIFVFDGIRTGWGFIFLIVQLTLPILVIRSFCRAEGLYRWWAARRERAMAAKQLKLDQANSAHHHQMELKSGHVPAAAPSLYPSELEEDADVAAERKRIEDITESTTDMVVMRNLCKQYGDAKVALKNVSLGVLRGECFGLLGPNGAGKSTACKLVLRELKPSSGDVIFPYAEVHTGTPQDEAFERARLGVCQQSDTLWEFLSAAEHMDQYLRLRLTKEYDAAKWNNFILRTIERVQLADAGEKQAGGYSGGMKRKLQVCLAMYTGARSVFLDEPSTGMDPFARRALWKIILEACSHNRCVLLTTHSMEEAEAVCGRISIITSGALRCLGTAQHLKDKFGSGYVITLTFDLVKVTPALIDALKKECVKKFGPSFHVQEELGNLHRYGVDKIPSLAEAFRFLNAVATTYAVEEYSVTQTASLEQIFLKFVNTTRDN